MSAPTDHDLNVLAKQAVSNLHSLLESKEGKPLRRGRTKAERGAPPRSHKKRLRVVAEDAGLIDRQRLDDGAWKYEAACRDSNGDWTELKQVRLEVIRQLKAYELSVCRSCTVTAECLEAGLSEPGGIWGGLFPRERRAIVRKRKAANVR